MTPKLLALIALLLAALPVASVVNGPHVLRSGMAAQASEQSQQVQPDTCKVVVTPSDVWGGTNSIPRNSPWSYNDQGRASIASMYPQNRILVERRSGAFGKIDYSLLGFQQTPADTVRLGVLAIDREANKVWHLTANCTLANWPAGLILLLESTASLQFPPR